MSWLVSARGRGLWRRPSTYLFCLATISLLVQLYEPALLINSIWPSSGMLLAYGTPWIAGPLIMFFAAAVLVEAALGWLPRLWLAAPLAIIGGYYGAFLVQRADVQLKAGQWSAENAVRSSRPTDRAEAILIDAREWQIASFLARYDYPGPYYSFDRGTFIRYDRRDAAACAAPAKDLPVVRKPIMLGREQPTPPVGTRICGTPGSPPPADVDVLSVSSTRDTYQLWQGWIEVERTLLTRNGRQEGVITTADAYGLGWWPVVYVGECGFGHLQSCFVHLWAETHIPVATLSEQWVDYDPQMLLLGFTQAADSGE